MRAVNRSCARLWRGSADSGRSRDRAFSARCAESGRVWPIITGSGPCLLKCRYPTMAPKVKFALPARQTDRDGRYAAHGHHDRHIACQYGFRSGLRPSGDDDDRVSLTRHCSDAGGPQCCAGGISSGACRPGVCRWRDFTIEARWGAGRDDQLPVLAAELVGQKVDILVGIGGMASRAAKGATTTIPIALPVVIDPRGDLVADLDRPGGNSSPPLTRRSQGRSSNSSRRWSLGWHASHSSAIKRRRVAF